MRTATGPCSAFMRGLVHSRVYLQTTTNDDTSPLPKKEEKGKHDRKVPRPTTYIRRNVPADRPALLLQRLGRGVHGVHHPQPQGLLRPEAAGAEDELLRAGEPYSVCVSMYIVVRRRRVFVCIFIYLFIYLYIYTFPPPRTHTED